MGETERIVMEAIKGEVESLYAFKVAEFKNRVGKEMFKNKRYHMSRINYRGGYSFKEVEREELSSYSLVGSDVPSSLQGADDKTIGCNPLSEANRYLTG